MKIRLYNPITDRRKLESWFAQRNFPHPDPDILPPRGLVASVNGEDMAMGFMFFTDGGIAIIGHLVSNPNSEAEVRRECVSKLLDSFSAMAKSQGFKAISCATNIKSLGQRFETYGFTKTDENVDHFRRELCL